MLGTRFDIWAGWICIDEKEAVIAGAVFKLREKPQDVPPADMNVKVDHLEVWNRLVVPQDRRKPGWAAFIGPVDGELPEGGLNDGGPAGLLA